MGHPARVVREAWIVGEIIPSGCTHQPLEDGVAVAADDDVLAVGAAVGVGRHDAGERRARGPADHVGAVVLGHDRLQHVEHGLVDGHVDDLAAAIRPRPLLEPEQDADDGVQRGERIADAQVRTHRRLTREAVDVPESPEALADGREPRP